MNKYILTRIIQITSNVIWRKINCVFEIFNKEIYNQVNPRESPSTSKS